ncbi:phosphate/phosphite/phosphonate ABC transporter substrate-binding protein [Arenimonas fontis]|nr:PhnD/SsuA/transferrin family substrate-binding protein [Arenimonas fontis]
MKRITGLSAMLLALASTGATAAEYTLTVEPNYPPYQAEQVYQPLLDYLSASTGHTFRLKTATNYHVYWRDLRNGVPTDFAFEEAHFTDYRITRLGFTPLVRVSDPTRYSLLTTADTAEGGLSGLIGYRVVSMPSPSLGYLALIELYRNPMAQPEILSEASNWKDGVDMIFAGESEGAMVPNYIAQLYPNLVSLSDSREFTGRALSAAGNVPQDVREAVTQAMLRLHEDPSQYEVLVELGATQFVQADAAEYAGSERLLRAVYGYKPAPVRPAEPAPETGQKPEVDMDALEGIRATTED